MVKTDFMKSLSLIGFAALLIIFSSCGNSGNGQKNAADSVKAVPLGPVTLASVSPSPDFPGASLSLKSCTTTKTETKGDKTSTDSVKVAFEFEVKNYELKLQTSDNGTKMCNNSDKGQHIHFILDNGPYKALYEPKNEVTLPNDSKEHILVAFLSRSYHESIKSKDAAIVTVFSAKNGKLVKKPAPTTPMIAYSRPKGDYTGKDTANILLDFYVMNCSLAPDGYKVVAEISNLDRPAQHLTATIDQWAPHFIQNLGTGKCKVTLSLVDKDGKKVEGPLTSASREFNLKEK